MAKHNPFRMFRKNQKAWLAGLTLFTMFSFIALGSMFQCLQVSAPQQQSVASVYAKTKAVGNLDHWKFSQHQDEIRRLSEFLNAATMKLVQEQAVIPYGQMLLVLENDPVSGQQVPVPLDNLTALFQELSWTLSDSRNVVDRWLVTELGLKKGLGADKNNVRGYLSVLFQNRLTPEDLSFALRQSGLSQDMLVGLLANQIVYERMIRQTDAGRRADPLGQSALPTGHGNVASVPGEALEAGERIFRNVKVDVAAFPAALYADQVSAPSEETLRAFYEQYKNLPYSAGSKTPGFFLPTKAAFEVVRAELTDERLAAVTDEEIAKYYEENKQEFAKPVAPPQTGGQPISGVVPPEELALPDADLSNVVPAPAEAAPVEAASAEAAPAEAAPAEAAPAEAAPAEEPKAETAPAETAPAEEPKAEEKPAEAAPAEEPKAEESNTEEKPAENASAEDNSPFRLVSYQEETPAEEKPAEEAAPAEEPKAEEKPAEEAAPAEEPKAEEKPAEEAAPAEEPKAEEKPAEEAAPAEAAPAETAPAEEAAPADPGFFTLDEVKEDIRRKIAGDRLSAEMDVMLEKMKTYADQLANKRANVSSSHAELTPIDLAAFAKDSGFEYFATTKTGEDGTVSSEMLDYAQASLIRLLPESTLQEVYASTPMEYAPEKTDLLAGTITLYWATEVKGEHLPEYEEVQELVSELWKRQEAVKLAEKDALALAETLKGGAKLADETAKSGEEKKYSFAKTEKFTGFSFPRGFRTPELSFGEIREEGVPVGEAERKNSVVVAPGKSFYEAVFGLEVGEAAVVRNQPEDRVFVIQLTEKDSDEAVLEKMADFDQDRFAQQALMTVEQIRNADFQHDWIEQLRREAGFEWVVIPPALRQ